MTQPLWATPDRKNHLVQFAMKYKGRCLKGHPLCSEIEHYHHVETRTEIASLPISPADVREGRAIAPYCHSIGPVELAQSVPCVRPIWFGAHSATSFEYAAKKNFNVSQNIDTDSVIAGKFDTWRRLWKECGHPGPMPRTFLTRHVHVAETDARDREEAESHLAADRDVAPIF